ncbi:MAG: hypothetical protein EOP01_03855 [Propionibacteriaceae bacterium]|nr:MAG: hypothetical protein EOP01_03855 [Propionibacteriaceae bacterium]
MPLTDSPAHRGLEVAASVDSDAIVRLVRSAERVGGRKPLNVAIAAEVHDLFDERCRLLGLSKREVVQQLIAGWVGKER